MRYLLGGRNVDLPNVSICNDEPNVVHYTPWHMPNNEIWYEALEKLHETTSPGGGLYKNGFNTTIQSHTFENGQGKIIFNDDVTSIGNSAFIHCYDLTNVTIPNSVTSIGNDAFYNCTGLTSVTIGNGVTSIGDEAFKGCSGLTSVTIPDSVTSIGTSAFSGCVGLTSVTIGSGVTIIGNSAFGSCSALTSVTIGSGVTTISSYAFQKCTGLTSITIPSSVTSIGNKAFYNSSKLTIMAITAITPPTLENINAISTATQIIIVPSESVDVYKAASIWSSFSSKIQGKSTE